MCLVFRVPAPPVFSLAVPVDYRKPAQCSLSQSRNSAVVLVVRAITSWSRCRQLLAVVHPHDVTYEATVRVRQTACGLHLKLVFRVAWISHLWLSGFFNKAIRDLLWNTLLSLNLIDWLIGSACNGCANHDEFCFVFQLFCFMQYVAKHMAT